MQKLDRCVTFDDMRSIMNNLEENLHGSIKKVIPIGKNGMGNIFNSLKMLWNVHDNGFLNFKTSKGN